MNIAAQIKRFREYATEQKFDAEVRMLATHLMIAFQIAPLERNLVDATSGTKFVTTICADNAELVYFWVRQQACCASCVRQLCVKKLQKDFVYSLLKLAPPLQHARLRAVSNTQA